MTDLEIVQTAAEHVIAEAERQRDENCPLPDRWVFAPSSIELFKTFAAELQRLRDQVYPR